MTYTYADEIEAVAGGEPILAAVIGDMGWSGYNDDERHAPGLARKGEVLTWDEARLLLAYEYDDGYGSPDCHAITVWTDTKVIFTRQYDGSTAVTFMQRNPAAHLPHMPGG